MGEAAAGRLVVDGEGDAARVRLWGRHLIAHHRIEITRPVRVLAIDRHARRWLRLRRDAYARFRREVDTEKRGSTALAAQSPRRRLRTDGGQIAVLPTTARWTVVHAAWLRRRIRRR